MSITLAFFKRFHLYFDNDFAKCILRDHVTFKKFLINNLELLRNSTIYWDNARKFPEEDCSNDNHSLKYSERATVLGNFQPHQFGI